MIRSWRAMNRAALTLVIFFLIGKAGGEPRATCKSVTKSDIRGPCDFLTIYSKEVVQCVDDKSRNITENTHCVANSSCCWDETYRKCFAKPRKCYVDLRKERCFSKVRDSNGIEGIYTGYSANGTYCYVPTIIGVSDGFARVVGYVKGYGFPIVNAPSEAQCGEKWDIVVKRQGASTGKCSVTIYNVTNFADPQAKEKIYNGDLRFGTFCIPNISRFNYFFDYDGKEERHHQCICRVIAWAESSSEEVPVSDDVKNYVRKLENRTTCTQILGMFIRSSWMRVLSLTNEGEANEVMNALVMLTKESKKLNFYDIEVFINSTTKVANYSFYNGVGKESADDLIKKTAFMASHLIESLMGKNEAPNMGRVSAVYQPMGGESDQPSSMYSNGRIFNEESKLKHELFKTVDLMAERIASRVQNLNNESEFVFRAPEKHIDLSLAVTKSLASSTLQHRIHHSNFSNTKNDVITVLKLPNDTAPEQENVAVVSVFYDYPVFKNDDSKRISNYLTVNVWKLGYGESKEVSVPVNFTLTRTDVLVNGEQLVGEPTCSFLVSNNSKEEWSDFGCKTTNSIYFNTITCECNHTTNFAILMKVTESQLPEEHNQALKIISVILGLLSVACLIATIFTFIVYRKTLLKDRMVIHFHLIIALFFGYISILPTSLLASPTSEYPSSSCIACAILTHYFYLAVFFWSLVEGIYLFYKIVLVFKRRWAEGVQKASPLIGWLCPFIIVLLSFTLSRTTLSEENAPDAYADPATCFLNVQNKMIWSFAGPVIFIIGVNIIILSKITYVVFKSSYSSNKLSAANGVVKVSASLKRSCRGAVILMPILGIPTVVALLYNIYEDSSTESVGSDLRLIFGAMGAYLQVILAGVQGIAVFFFYCLCNDEVRSAHKLATHRRKSQSSLDIPLSKGRKHSRIPLLFLRGDVTSEGTLSQSQTKSGKKSSSNDFYQTTRRGTITTKDNVRLPHDDATSAVTYGRSLSPKHNPTIIIDI